jgi:hypothetical protein
MAGDKSGMCPGGCWITALMIHGLKLMSSKYPSKSIASCYREERSRSSCASPSTCFVEQTPNRWLWKCRRIAPFDDKSPHELQGESLYTTIGHAISDSCGLSWALVLSCSIEAVFLSAHHEPCSYRPGGVFSCGGACLRPQAVCM